MTNACDITRRPEEPDANPSDEEIKELLSGAKTIAIVGLSNKPHRESFGVGKYLLDHGFKVIPVHPNIAQWEGIDVVKSLSDINEPVDIVDVFRRADSLLELGPEAIAIKPKAVWFQLGIVNNLAAKVIRDTGPMVIQNKCIKIEHNKHF